MTNTPDGLAGMPSDDQRLAAAVINVRGQAAVCAAHLAEIRDHYRHELGHSNGMTACLHQLVQAQTADAAVAAVQNLAGGHVAQILARAAGRELTDAEKAEAAGWTQACETVLGILRIEEE